jgi:hypothetical protein
VHLVVLQLGGKPLAHQDHLRLLSPIAGIGFPFVVPIFVVTVVTNGLFFYTCLDKDTRKHRAAAVKKLGFNGKLLTVLIKAKTRKMSSTRNKLFVPMLERFL